MYFISKKIPVNISYYPGGGRAFLNHFKWKSNLLLVVGMLMKGIYLIVDVLDSPNLSLDPQTIASNFSMVLLRLPSKSDASLPLSLSLFLVLSNTTAAMLSTKCFKYHSHSPRTDTPSHRVWNYMTADSHVSRSSANENYIFLFPQRRWRSASETKHRPFTHKTSLDSPIPNFN